MCDSENKERVVFTGFWWDYCTRRYNSEYRRVLFELLEPNPEATYLDLGCGDGTVAKRVAEHIGTDTVAGVELSKKLASQARRKGISIQRRDLDKGLPWADSTFDVVTANQIIEHVDNTDLLLKEIRRVLKPRGYAIISTNNLAALHWIVLLMLGKQPPTACISDEMYGDTRMHRRLFTMPGLVAAVRYFGFKAEKAVGTYYFPFPVPIARLLCKVDKRHASCITLKVRKPCTD